MTDVLDINELVDRLPEREGGYANHPADRGGPTCFGITQDVARANGYYGQMRDLPPAALLKPPAKTDFLPQTH